MNPHLLLRGLMSDYGGDYTPQDQNGNGIDDATETGHADFDGDGVWDEYDNDRNGDGIDDVFQTDTDHNGLVDIYEDLDDDGDGISNPYDPHPGFPDPRPVVLFDSNPQPGAPGYGVVPNYVPGGDDPTDPPTDPPADPSDEGENMNVGDLADFARDLSGVYQKDLAPDRLVWRFVASAAHDFLTRVEWPFLRKEGTATLAAGATTVPLPSLRLRAVTVTVAGTVRVLEAMTFTDEQRLGTGSGSGPAGYRIDRTSGLLRIFPAPAAPVQVRISFDEIPTIGSTGTSSVAVIPAKYQEALAYKAAARLVAREGEDATRQSWLEGEYESLIQSAVTELFAEVSDQTLSFNADAGTRLDGRGGFGVGSAFYGDRSGSFEMWEF